MLGLGWWTDDASARVTCDALVDVVCRGRGFAEEFVLRKQMDGVQQVLHTLPPSSLSPPAACMDFRSFCAGLRVVTLTHSARTAWQVTKKSAGGSTGAWGSAGNATGGGGNHHQPSSGAASTDEWQNGIPGMVAAGTGGKKKKKKKGGGEGPVGFLD